MYSENVTAWPLFPAAACLQSVLQTFHLVKDQEQNLSHNRLKL